MEETCDVQFVPRQPGPDAIEQHWWRQFLSGPADSMAALDMRLRGAHGVTIRDLLLLELLSRPDRRSHRICVLAQMLGVSQSRLATQVRRLEGRGLVTRHPSKRDPRGMLPRITAEGHRRLHAVLETHAPEYVRDQLDYLQHEA